jgi:predicted small secreted protein
MPRQKLLTIAALIAALAVTACADLTGPGNDGVCPITGGSDTCQH